MPPSLKLAASNSLRFRRLQASRYESRTSRSVFLALCCGGYQHSHPRRRLLVRLELLADLHNKTPTSSLRLSGKISTSCPLCPSFLNTLSTHIYLLPQPGHTRVVQHHIGTTSSAIYSKLSLIASSRSSQLRGKSAFSGV